MRHFKPFFVQSGILHFMKALVFILYFGLFQVVYADAFDDGLAAYTKGDYETAIQLWRPTAEQGDVDAQRNLGAMYEQGKGVTQDSKEAAMWYRKAAEQEHAPAQCNLGNMYALGRGVQRDYMEAMKWFRKAADQGSAQAQHNLGVMFENGWGVRQDDAIAYAYYRLAAAQGDKGARDALKRVAIHEANQRILVRNVQQHLTELSYQPGPSDGISGRQTIAAVKAYQRDNEIKPDGIISESLLASLKKSLTAPPSSVKSPKKKWSYSSSIP